MRVIALSEIGITQIALSLYIPRIHGESLLQFANPLFRVIKTISVHLRDCDQRIVNGNRARSKRIHVDARGWRGVPADQTIAANVVLKRAIEVGESHANVLAKLRLIGTAFAHRE